MLSAIPHMRGRKDYPYNAFMAIPFRSGRRSSLPALPETRSEAGSLPPLTPDITTARERPAPSRSGSSGPALDPLADISIVEARHPDIARAITLLWGYPEMNEYFDRIWVADGFHTPIDPDAMSELMLLARLHQSILPQRPGRNMASILASGRLHEHPSGDSRDPWRDVPPRR